MKRCLAFVLGGGGARGAMQVGALRALIEANIKPDLIVGTSIGAANAVGLALWGVDLAGIETLERTYQEITDMHLMDSRLVRFALRALSKHPNQQTTRRITEFFIEKGITPEFQFDQIPDIRLALIGADLDSGQPVIYGQYPGQSILAGLLASIALPPWFVPIEEDGHCIIDGGALCNLPIEPAVKLGATEIIALDLNDPDRMLGAKNPQDQYLEKLIFAIAQRQVCLETTLATFAGVPVHYVPLRSLPPVPIWDFRNHQELFKIGYETMRRKISDWNKTGQKKLSYPTLVSVN